MGSSGRSTDLPQVRLYLPRLAKRIFVSELLFIELLKLNGSRNRVSEEKFVRIVEFSNNLSALQSVSHFISSPEEVSLWYRNFILPLAEKKLSADFLLRVTLADIPEALIRPSGFLLADMVAGEHGRITGGSA